MKQYHAIDRFVRKLIREGQLLFLYIGFFIGTWIVLCVGMIYANILHLSFAVNFLFPLYCAFYATALLLLRIHFKQLSSILDAVVLRRVLRVNVTICMLCASLFIPLHISILRGYALHAVEIPVHIMIIEFVSYAVLLALSLAQCILIWKNDRWPVGEDVENTMAAEKF